MSRTEQLRQLAITWNDAWNSRDPARLEAFFTPDGTYYDPDLPAGAIAGKQGIRQVAQKTWADWPQASFEALTITVEDPRVVLEWRSTAKHRSGVELQLEGVDLLVWEGDKVSAARSYYDVHSRAKALAQKQA